MFASLETVQFDPDGFMNDARAWSESIGESIAEREGLALTARHWDVIRYMRTYWEKNGESPSLRTVTKNSGVDTKEMYALFPKGPAKLAAKIAGLKKPTGCI